MRFDGKDNKQKFSGMTISKLSSVGKPAHKPAVASIIKAAGEKVDAEVAKRMFSEVMESMGMDEKKREFMRELYKMSEAVQNSIRSIIMNPQYTNKKEQIGTTLTQFMSAMSAMMDSSQIMKSEDLSGVLQTYKAEWEDLLKDFPNVNEVKLAKIHSPENGDQMDFVEILKQMGMGDMAGKKMMMDGKMMSMEDMTPAQRKKAMVEYAMKDKGKKGMSGKMKKSILDMDGDSLDYFKGLSDEDQESFIGKSATEQSAEVAIAKAGEETLVANGQTIKKSAVGPEVFAFMKAQAEETEKTKAALAKSQEENEMKDNIAKAEAMFPNLAGTPEEKGAYFKSVMAMPETVRNATIKALAGADAAQGTDYDELGTSVKKSTDVHKAAEDKLNSIAKGIQKENPNMTFETAYSKALDTQEGAAAYEEQRR